MSPNTNTLNMRRNSGTTSRNARVLIVEDNIRLRKLMTDVLVLEGFTVTEAGDAGSMRSQMRIKAQEEYPDEPFDLIVTDIQMPGETGLVALEWLRHRGCPTPALVVTAFPELATREQVRRLDATLLPKPFSLYEFRSVAVATFRPNESTILRA